MTKRQREHLRAHYERNLTPEQRARRAAQERETIANIDADMRRFFILPKSNPNQPNK